LSRLLQKSSRTLKRVARLAHTPSSIHPTPIQIAPTKSMHARRPPWPRLTVPSSHVPLHLLMHLPRAHHITRLLHACMRIASAVDKREARCMHDPHRRVLVRLAFLTRCTPVVILTAQQCLKSATVGHPWTIAHINKTALSPCYLVLDGLPCCACHLLTRALHTHAHTHCRLWRWSSQAYYSTGFVTQHSPSAHQSTSCSLLVQSPYTVCYTNVGSGTGVHVFCELS
jgi:hypothetical protein